MGARPYGRMRFKRDLAEGKTRTIGASVVRM